MHYVKHFNINGVDTRQIPCVAIQGKPNAATEGCVGALCIDVTSPLHDVYKCVAVNGSIYTWELLSSDLSNYYTKSEINALLENIQAGGSPIEISTEEEMTALLETAEIGTIYKYTGESGIYENGALYVVEEGE